MTRPIVCAVDGSGAVRDAVSVAADLAEVLELDLMLLHVATPEPALTVAVSPHHHVREADIEGLKATASCYSVMSPRDSSFPVPSRAR
jgi:nucleotide-binding universal stress UspA family protein